VLRDHDRVLRDHDRVLRDHDRVLRDHDRVLRDHDRVLRDHDRVLRDHDRVLRDHDRVLRDHDRVLRDHDRVLRDHDPVTLDQRRVPALPYAGRIARPGGRSWHVSVSARDGPDTSRHASHAAHREADLGLLSGVKAITPGSKKNPYWTPLHKG
jgi:hypothetical protein